MVIEYEIVLLHYPLPDLKNSLYKNASFSILGVYPYNYISIDKARCAK
jgi:hypothetical protein